MRSVLCLDLFLRRTGERAEYLIRSWISYISSIRIPTVNRCLASADDDADDIYFKLWMAKG